MTNENCNTPVNNRPTGKGTLSTVFRCIGQYRINPDARIIVTNESHRGSEIDLNIETALSRLKLEACGNCPCRQNLI